MFLRAACMSLGVAVLIVVAPVRGGYYNSSDALEETSRFSTDYEGVFRRVLNDLKAIPNPNPESNPPIRRRYVLAESLGLQGVRGLQTLEEKLDYSAVLIRRGKADEAVQVLLPLVEEHPKNFLVYAHCSSAHFLASSDDFRVKAGYYINAALKRWPAHWDGMTDEQKVFLTGLGWHETTFERYRVYESAFQRLVVHRLDEDKRRRKKMLTEESVDPIFVDDNNKPLRFVNEAGEFEVGRIADAERKKLPRNAIDIVEQLLIWMPNDDRLLWLLGEVLNASAAEQRSAPGKKDEAKNQMIHDAQRIFQQLMTDSFVRQIYAPKQIKERAERLSEYVRTMPPPRLLDPELVPDNDKNADSPLTSEQWLRALAVGFISGFAVGLAALWQFQEMRRRRKARSV